MPGGGCYDGDDMAALPSHHSTALSLLTLLSGYRDRLPGPVDLLLCSMPQVYL